MPSGKSDLRVVLGVRESRIHGEAAGPMATCSGVHFPYSEMDSSVNKTGQDNSEDQARKGVVSCECRRWEPDAGNSHVGFWGGASGATRSSTLRVPYPARSLSGCGMGTAELPVIGSVLFSQSIR